MKNQDLFSSKDKSKKLKCRLLQFLFSPLRVNPIALRKAKIVYNFGLSECSRVNVSGFAILTFFTLQKQGRGSLLREFALPEANSFL